MTDGDGDGDDGVWRPNVSFDKDQINWPLSYSLRPCPDGAPPRKWFDHSYYRGPGNQSVQILYSSSRSHSEVIAQGFLNEPVLGFDMEWPVDADKRPRLQDKIALIQIACERKIALFHIARHDGETSEDLIAPSLRRIIESVNILKTGVAVLNADFSRLEKHFHLHPRGAFELSHLHHLVTTKSHNSGKVTSKLCALSKQVEHHLGLPLYKGSVRTSNWSSPLDDDQKTYAANDAYVGFMLFHCMNAKRLQMSPVPSLPKLAESHATPTKPPNASTENMRLELQAYKAEDAVMTAKHAFTTQPTGNQFKYNPKNLEAYNQQETGDIHVKEEVEGPNSSKINAPCEPQISHKLYGQLASHRSRLATTRNVQPYIIASNKLLNELARHRPVTRAELLKISGVGEYKLREFGDDWLRIISRDVAKHPKEILGKARLPLQPASPNRDAKARKDVCREDLDPISYGKLYKRLAEHRKACAYDRDWPAFRIAPNTVLEALARKRPSNTDELLLIDGIGKFKAAEYGTDWLRIIAAFEAEQRPAPGPPASSISNVPPYSPAPRDTELPQPEPDDHPSKRRKIRNVGRSKELVFTQPTLSTGLSFQFAETQLHDDENPAENDDGDVHDGFNDSVALATNLPSPELSEMRHKAAMPLELPHMQASTPSLALDSAPPSNPMSIPVPEAMEEAVQSEPLSLEQQLLRKKLDACAKSVAFLMNPKPTQPIVSDDTLDCLVTTVPQTLEEFLQVPGIQGFIQACQGVKKNLWSAFATWTRTAGLVRGS
ncbi:hypothetical protein F5Y05DRAFT_362419 [Hypoxylon sp. FL0543]|nr:hypothetical protein F5Y05DRAFT_362419 [Hypoxylon sp. FL0543]